MRSTSKARFKSVNTQQLDVSLAVQAPVREFTADSLQEWIHGPACSPLDRHFARLLERLAARPSPELVLSAALASRARAAGHSCLHLKALSGELLPAEIPENNWTLRLPTWEQLERTLRQSGVVGRPQEFFPMILDESGRLYLHRYWEYEQQVAQRLKFFRDQTSACDEAKLREPLLTMFSHNDAEQGVDWQKAAVLLALTRRLCVISGGPGTGKTRTVVLLLALIVAQSEDPVRIAVAAPTGKAAARLKESIQRVRLQLQLPTEVSEKLPSDALTVHRLLGPISDSAYFRHNAQNRLPVDILVLDEASMVDLALMAKLLEALPDSARVVLVGDKDQLSSVEAGAVLGDLCDPESVNFFSASFRAWHERMTGQSLPAPPPNSYSTPAADMIIQLERNYRFGEESVIFQLSRAVNRGEADHALQILETANGDDLVWRPFSATFDLKEQLRPLVRNYFASAIGLPTPEEVLEAFGRFRILTALRHGPFGALHLNRLVEEILVEEDVIRKTGTLYAGRPIIVTRNDYNLRLFNGDIGMLLPHNGELRAFFGDMESTLKSFLPVRLPEHETAFAMTVHKSQGSEFEKVLLILPDGESPVVTRELIYTGLTRASRKLELWAAPRHFKEAVVRRVARSSGLREAMRSQ